MGRKTDAISFPGATCQRAKLRLSCGLMSFYSPQKCLFFPIVSILQCLAVVFAVLCCVFIEKVLRPHTLHLFLEQKVPIIANYMKYLTA